MSEVTTQSGQKAPGLPVDAVQAKVAELGQHVLRMTSASGSGHPSSALALSHLVVELMYRRMRYDLADPWHPANDRLVLSLGHAVPIVYAAYADLGGVVGRDRKVGRALSVKDLAGLREQGSVLDGHPNPAEGFPFFDAATGSLGQGLSVAAGLGLAARLDGLDRRIYAIIGDGESREGQVWEALDFIVDHKLTNVCAIFSCNGHGQAGPVSPQQSVKVLLGKLEAYGWRTMEIDGHDPAEIAEALDAFNTTTQPLAIVARTVKGWGVPMMLGRNYHGKPLPEAELDVACAQLVEAAGGSLDAGGDVGRPSGPATMHRAEGEPRATLVTFEEALARVGLEGAIKKGKLATRVAYGAALVALADSDQRIVALDGDVSNSTFAEFFAREHPHRYFECKIAEQNMISAGAGLAAAGKIPFASSFGKFIARAADQIDMAAISRSNLKIVGSHTGVSLAADGPSQMAVSDVAYFRSLCGVDAGDGATACHLFHPADAICAYRCCELMADLHGLCYLRTHRPDAPFLYAFDEQFAVGGCKRLREGDRLTLASSGFMVHSVLAAADQLAAQGIVCQVFDCYTLPLDAAPILDAARKAGGSVLTVEDNYAGGLHAELAEAAAKTGDVRVTGMTVRRIPKSARTAEEVFAYTGVGVADIVAEARRLTG